MMMGTTVYLLHFQAKSDWQAGPIPEPNRVGGTNPGSRCVSSPLVHQASVLQQALTFHHQLHPSSFSKATALSRECGFQAKSWVRPVFGLFILKEGIVLSFVKAQRTQHRSMSLWATHLWGLRTAFSLEQSSFKVTPDYGLFYIFKHIYF